MMMVMVIVIVVVVVVVVVVIVLVVFISSPFMGKGPLHEYQSFVLSHSLIHLV